MTEYRGHRGRYFWGVLIVIIGVLFLLDRMQIIGFWDVASKCWPLLLVLIGLSTLFGSRFKNFLAGSLLLILGILFEMSELGILKDGVWHYIWPVAIILFGLWMILRPSIRRGFHPGTAAISEDELDISIIFNGLKRRVSSQAFRGGRISTVMGGVNLDLSGAKISGDRITIEISAVMGGVGLKVPKNWKLIIEASPVMGGIEDRTAQLHDDQTVATLLIRASTVMGGVEITN